MNTSQKSTESRTASIGWHPLFWGISRGWSWCGWGKIRSLGLGQSLQMCLIQWAYEDCGASQWENWSVIQCHGRRLKGEIFTRQLRSCHTYSVVRLNPILYDQLSVDTMPGKWQNIKTLRLELNFNLLSHLKISGTWHIQLKSCCLRKAGKSREIREHSADCKYKRYPEYSFGKSDMDASDTLKDCFINICPPMIWLPCYGQSIH